MKYIDAEKITPTMAEYVADVFSRKEHLDNISYGYCMEIAEAFRGYAERAKQEQPELALEKEIDRFLKSEESTSYENAGSYKVAVKDPKKLALHFYELGLNARKEDEKGILAEVMQLAGFKPPFLDGNQYCTLFGIDLMRSFVGFGNTETESFVEALKDVKNFIEK